MNIDAEWRGTNLCGFKLYLDVIEAFLKIFHCKSANLSVSHIAFLKPHNSLTSENIQYFSSSFVTPKVLILSDNFHIREKMPACFPLPLSFGFRFVMC